MTTINKNDHVDTHCENCVWDGVAYWDDNHQPIAQWISCETCDWGND